MSALTKGSGLTPTPTLSTTGEGLTAPNGLTNIDGPSFDPAATAFFSAVTAAGGSTSAGRKTLYNNLFVSLRSDGILPLLDRLGIFAAENAGQAYTDLISLTQVTPVASPTLTTDRGVAGDGVASYVNTGYTPNTSKVHYALNSAFFCYYTNSVVGSFALGGAEDGTTRTEILAPFFGGAMTGRVNEPSGLAAGSTVNAPGLFLADRTGAGAVNLSYNGTVNTVTADPSVALPTVPLYICADNSNNSVPPSGLTQSTMTLWACGGSLGATKIGLFYTRILTFLTAIGAQ